MGPSFSLFFYFKCLFFFFFFFALSESVATLIELVSHDSTAVGYGYASLIDTSLWKLTPTCWKDHYLLTPSCVQGCIASLFTARVNLLFRQFLHISLALTVPPFGSLFIIPSTEGMWERETALGPLRRSSLWIIWDALRKTDSFKGLTAIAPLSWNKISGIYN